MKIIPAILVQSEAEFLQQSQAIEGATDIVHIDIADGEFVPETTWADPESVSANLKTDCELHLMVKDPLAVIENWKGVPQVKSVIIHQDTVSTNWRLVIDTIHDLDWKAILAVGNSTPHIIMDSADGIMYMGVTPGGQGRPFNNDVIEYIALTKKDSPERFVQVDGGVNEKTIFGIKSAGTDAACVGSAIFGHGDPVENLKNLQTLIAE